MERWTLPSTLLLATTLLIASTAVGSIYVGGATFVARDTALSGFGTLVDDGGLACRQSTGSGVGGACIPWSSLGPGENFTRVQDETQGTQIAYQVCIDNDGDRICGGQTTVKGCQDQIFFSHDDDGNFFNPLGPLPTGFASVNNQTCPGGYAGWLVFLCQGNHVTAGAGPHQHPVTAGTVTAVTSGSGFGDFCGGGVGSGTGLQNEADPKPYVILP